jgi:hypothetical protein
MSLCSHSGQPQAIARYSLRKERRCIKSPKSRADAAVFATSTKPLVSRSSLFTIETCPPLAISNASSSRSCFQSVGALFGLVG